MRYEKRTFKGETVVLDGHVFVDCVIQDCVVIFNASEGVTLANTSLDRIKFVFGGSALTTLCFLQILRSASGDAAMLKLMDNVSSPPAAAN